MEETLPPAKSEWRTYQEIRKQIEQNQVYAPFLRLTALSVYTCAHKGVRTGTDSFVQELQSRQGDVAPKEASLLQSAHDITDNYARICLDLNESVRSHWLSWYAIEDASTRTELGVAVSKYLFQVGSFSFRDLLNHMEKHYTEKKLLKYVGSIPIYKDVQMFTREAIQKKLESFIKASMVMHSIPGTQPQPQLVEKGRKKEDPLSQMYSDSDRFLSLPYAYSILYWQWDPTVFNPKLEEELKEIERVMQEILGCQLNNLQSSKVLRLIFKDCEGNYERILSNYAKIISLYYKQMNEPIPHFIEQSMEGAMLKIGGTKSVDRPTQAPAPVKPSHLHSPHGMR